mgnify:FL=1
MIGKVSVTLTLAQLPIFIIIFLFLSSDIVVNPISYLINASGHVSIIFLFITLFSSRITFLRENLDRRTLGLTSFFYLIMHVLFYFFDNHFIISYMIDDLINLSFIQIGYFALILFLPLVFSSNSKAKTILGDLWSSIHKIIYLIMALSLIHYYQVIKADFIYMYIYLLLSLFVLVKSSNIQKHGS